MASLNLSMPDELRKFVDRRTREGSFRTPSEYVRQLIREDQENEADRRLEALLLKRLDEGEFEAATPEMFERLRARVRNGLKRKRKAG